MCALGACFHPWTPSPEEGCGGITRSAFCVSRLPRWFPEEIKGCGMGMLAHHTSGVGRRIGSELCRVCAFCAVSDGDSGTGGPSGAVTGLEPGKALTEGWRVLLLVQGRVHPALFGVFVCNVCRAIHACLAPSLLSRLLLHLYPGLLLYPGQESLCGGETLLDRVFML